MKSKLCGQPTADIVANQLRQKQRHKEHDNLNQQHQVMQQQVQIQLQQQPHVTSRQYRKHGPVTCPTCAAVHPSQKALVMHIKTAHPGYKYPCPVPMCPRTFNSFYTWYKHMKEHQAPTFFCSGCTRTFHFQSELDRHKPVHSVVLPFACNLCVKRCASAKSLT